MTPAHQPHPSFWPGADRRTGEPAPPPVDTGAPLPGRVLEVDDAGTVTVLVPALSPAPIRRVPVVGGAPLAAGVPIVVAFLQGEVDRPVVLGPRSTPGLLAAAADLSALADTVAELAGLLVDLEDWHYVGDPGEPAFENGWTNLGPHVGTTLPRLAFRRRGSRVDLAGYLYGPDATGAIVFTHLDPTYVPVGKQANLPFSMSPDFATLTAAMLQVWGTESGPVPAPGVVAVVIPGVATGFAGPWPLGLVLDGSYALHPPVAA